MTSAAQAIPVPIPTLTVLPPSSDTESCSRSPGLRPRRHRARKERGRERKRRGEDLEDQRRQKERDESERGREGDRRSPSPLLLLPPTRSWSRSSSPSRRSRWSLKSLLSRESTDCDSCSTASNSPRSTPGSSPSVRRRVLGGRASEGEGGGDRSGGGSDSPLPPTPSSSSSYPLGPRHFTRNAKVLSPTYKQRNEDFRKLFKKLPDTERLIVEGHPAAGTPLSITILLKDVTTLTKEKTAKLIPNAIQISTDHDKHFFTSFGARDRSYMMIFRLWQNALMDKPLSPKELWHIVHQCYGTELGLTSEDDDYVSPTEHINGLLPGEESVSVSELLELSSTVGMSCSPPSSTPCGPGSAHLWTSPWRCGMELNPSPAPPAPRVPSPPPHTPPRLAAPPRLGNLSSLDITNDEELPTDPSNSSDTQEESEVESFCADLSGRLHINTVVRMGPTQSSVVKEQTLPRAATATVLPWRQQLQASESTNQSECMLWEGALSRDAEAQSSVRLQFCRDRGSECPIRALELLTGGVFVASVGWLNRPYAVLTLYKSSARGECYVVDSEVITSGIPYQDYFYTVHRYCLTSVNRHKSRLRVSSDICYRKQPWSLVKALIEKNTWSGIEEYYRHMEMEVCKLETLLQSEVSVVGAGEGVAADAAKTPPALRRRKRNCSRRAGERERDAGAQYLKLGDRSRGGGGISTILLIVSFILVVLVALNMLLFYKLWALERAAHTLETWHSYSLTDSTLSLLLPHRQVLQMQRQFHQAQLSKWQQILQSSVTLLDQMKQSLEKLHKGIVTPEVQQEPPSEAPTETLTQH
ncbi:hypothetical protein JZ751_004751 [Albula glossodonta]|uniref:VASt domain-containing protein n=1 Tax=Albula glossodonta TaxID=121402 RepID=A0A8T2N4T8_9TELE|nr:hypothetical protein JZ751_004751 [Albula glossodonta]